MKTRSNMPQRNCAFTLAEMMVTCAVASLVISGAMTFVIFAQRSVSATNAQITANGQASYAIQLIQNRIQLATMVSNDITGNSLTLGFDTDYHVDSKHGGNGVPWANQDYYEQFQFVGTNTTNALQCSPNQLIYYSNTLYTNHQVLVPCGVRNLKGHTNIFFVTNSVLVSICFGIVDTNRQDTFQSIEIQAMGASLNRPQVNNMVSILPAP
jgi:competence protein ComGC